MFTLVKEFADYVASCFEPELELKADGSNAELFYFPVDPITQQSFCKNYAGFLRNDIQTIVEQEDEILAADLLKRLNETPEDLKPYAEISDSELIQGLASKYCQTPSEVIAHLDSILERKQAMELKKKEAVDLQKQTQEAKEARMNMWNSMTSAEKDAYIARKREKEISDVLDFV